MPFCILLLSFSSNNSLNACLSNVTEYLYTFTLVQDRSTSSTSAADIKYATTTSDCGQTVLCVIVRGMVPSRGDSHVSCESLYGCNSQWDQIIPVGKYDCVYLTGTYQGYPWKWDYEREGGHSYAKKTLQEIPRTKGGTQTVVVEVT